MNSLRVRLILGFGVVAVIPLVLAMALLSQRIRETVRTQAADRLGAALGILQAQLRSDGSRVTGKLEILGKDPALKRLYLVRSDSGQELSEYLAEKQFLLGFDFLLVADTSGGLIADGSTHDVLPASRLARAPAPGLVVEPVVGQPALVMAATAPILYQNQRVGVVRGGIVLDRAFLERLKQASGVDLTLSDAGGRSVAGTAPEAASPGSMLARTVPLVIGPAPHATIRGRISTASADQAIAALLSTAVVLGLVGLAIAIVLGVLWSLQVSRPVERLARFSQRIARGEWDEPLELRSMRELQTLVDALDRMRGDLRSYRERLVASERQAAWSQMARKVAHEIKNPLTPIAVSVADLKRSYQQKRADFPEILDRAVATVGEEVQALKRMLQEFSDYGRLPSPRFAPCGVSDLLGEMEALYGRDVAEDRLQLSGLDQDLAICADRGQLRQVLVNLIKNGLEAVDEEGGRVRVEVRNEGATLAIAVSDTGPGLGPEQKAQLFVPNFTTKAHGSGLGLTIVQRIVSDHHGTIAVDSVEGRGTTFCIRLPVRHEGDECQRS